MKKILAAILISFGLFEIAYAVDMDVWTSSNTVTADTNKNLCAGTSTVLVNGSTQTWGNHGVFHGVCINTGASAGTIAIFNSSAPAVASAPIATVLTSTAMPCSLYDVGITSGLTYTKTGLADATILYQCY